MQLLVTEFTPSKTPPLKCPVLLDPFFLDRTFHGFLHKHKYRTLKYRSTHGYCVVPVYSTVVPVGTTVVPMGTVQYP